MRRIQQSIIEIMSSSVNNFFSLSGLGPAYILSIISSTEVDHVDGPYFEKEYQSLIDSKVLVESKRWPGFYTLNTN